MIIECALSFRRFGYIVEHIIDNPRIVFQNDVAFDCTEVNQYFEH